MLKATVNNKCSNYQYVEDCLTSSVFGAFRYLDMPAKKTILIMYT